MYSSEHTSPDQAAYMALNDVNRANLLLRVHHAFKAIAAHPSDDKHYDAPVKALTWLTEELKVRGLNELATDLESRTDRLRTIAESPRNGRRPQVQMRLNGALGSAYRHLERWNEQALRQHITGFVAPISDNPDAHESYLNKAKYYYNTDQMLPFNYKKFMAVTADKGVRLQQFNDRDLRDLVTRTQELFYDIARRNPHELARWYVAAHASAQKPEAWQTVYANLQFSALPTQLVASMLSYTPESGLVIEQDVTKVMDALRSMVQEPSRSAAR